MGDRIHSLPSYTALSINASWNAYIHPIEEFTVPPLRSWTIPGDNPLVITIHRPAVTIRYGDGPEVELSPSQVEKLSTRMDDAEAFFDSDDPEVLA